MIRVGLILALSAVAASAPGQSTPRVINLSPPNGATDVDPRQVELRVFFDQDMQTGMSWCGGGPQFPEVTSQGFWASWRTCVLTVRLQPSKTYQLGINCPSFRNFMSRGGVSAEPMTYTFTTAAAPGQGRLYLPPRIVDLQPPRGAADVNPETDELRVTFDQDMQTGMSWCGGGPNFPEVTGSGQWVDSRTCVLPVRLQPGHQYELGINCQSFQNFRSVDGTPAQPTPHRFRTARIERSGPVDTEPPSVVEMVPANGARDVPHSLGEIHITFDKPMGEGRSLVGGGEMFPLTDESRPMHWTEDRRTIVWPVQLEPGHHYRFGINSHSHTNFRSEVGIPVDPVRADFWTGSED